MAINVNFAGTTIYKPGMYGPPEYWYQKQALLRTLTNAGIAWEPYARAKTQFLKTLGRIDIYEHI